MREQARNTLEDVQMFVAVIIGDDRSAANEQQKHFFKTRSA